MIFFVFLIVPILAAAASAAVSSSVASAIAKSGNGLIFNKGKKSFIIEPKDDDGIIVYGRKIKKKEGSGLFLWNRGNGLYLRQHDSGSGSGLYLKNNHGDGLYLKKYGDGMSLVDRHNIPNLNNVQKNILLDII